jgi:hypothetical protein
VQGLNIPAVRLALRALLGAMHLEGSCSYLGSGAQRTTCQKYCVFIQYKPFSNKAHIPSVVSHTQY